MIREAIVRLAPEFILKRVVPTAAELAYGYQIGWVSASDVRAVADFNKPNWLPVWLDETFLPPR